MPISEEQFEAMTKDTIHQGKYSLPQQQHVEKEAPVSETDKLSKSVRKAAPWILLPMILTNPATWVVFVFLLLCLPDELPNTLIWIMEQSDLFKISFTVFVWQLFKLLKN